MTWDLKAILVAGMLSWWSSLILTSFYVRRYIRSGNKRPSAFTLIVILICLTGTVYNAIRLIFGPTMAVFYAMSSMSTLLSLVMLGCIVVKLMKRDGPLLDEVREAKT